MKIDSMPTALYSGLQGYQKAEQGVAEAAAQINKLNTEQDRVANIQDNSSLSDNFSTSVSLTTEVVNLVVNEHLAKASTKVIATADEVMGTLIDTKV